MAPRPPGKTAYAGYRTALNALLAEPDLPVDD